MRGVTTRTRVFDRRAIERRFEERGYRRRRPLRWTWCACGRHRSRAQLSDHFLPHRTVVGNACEICVLEDDTRRGRRALRTRVVAADAVLREDALNIGRRHRSCVRVTLADGLGTRHLCKL